jgi:hypothetical protein
VVVLRYEDFDDALWTVRLEDGAVIDHVWHPAIHRASLDKPMVAGQRDLRVLFTGLEAFPSKYTAFRYDLL